ncbi:MAG: sugar phosphate isomerase/epimerase family protein [Verrucomicrobiota bacterium]
MPAPRSFKKGLMFNTLRGPAVDPLSLREKFALLRAAGFDGVELRGSMNQAEVLAARDATGLVIASVNVATNWVRPLSDANPTVRAAGLEGLRQALRDAKAYGATSVLLVPAVVNKETSYAEAYTRSTAEIAKAVPLAESLGVAIAVENVWNQFLLSPLEAVQYVDAFKSPFVRWHFDVGNCVQHGWPEHWIRALGPRIAKVHVKEFSRKQAAERGPRAGFNCELMTGDSDWPAVMQAIDATGYQGWMITEQRRPPGLDGAAYLEHLAKKLDAIFAA